MRYFRGDQYALFFFTFWILWTFYFIFNAILFFKKKNNVYIKCRAPALIFSSGIGQYLMITVLVWEIVSLPNHFPTIIDNWFIWLCIPLHLMPYPIRAIRFLIQYHLSNYQIKKIERLQNEDFKPNKAWEWFMANPKYRSDTAFFVLNWILQAVLVAIGIFRNIRYTENHPGQYGIVHSNLYYISCTVMLVIASAIVWITVYFMFRIQDSVYYRVELISIGIIWIVFIGLYIIFDWQKIGDFRLPLIMLIVLCVLSFMISFGMPVQLAQTDDSLKEEYNIVTSPTPEESTPNQVQTTSPENIEDQDNADRIAEWQKQKEAVKKQYSALETCLEIPELHSMFMTFLQGQQCPEALLFYDEVKLYRLIESRDDLITKFISIRNTYIVDGSGLQVNVGIKVAQPVIDLDPQDATTKSFDQCDKANLTLMKTDCFPSFRISSPYKKYIEKKQNEIPCPS